MIKTTFLLSSFLLLSAINLNSQTTINVPEDYPTIQSALLAAEWNSTIEVAAGTYTGSIFWLPNLTDVKLIGEGSEMTFLIGDSLNHVINISQPEEFGFGANARIQGFTIENSTASALNIENASPHLSDLVFNGNIGNRGGAIYLNNYDGTIENCIFNGNEAQSGGAIYAEDFSGTVQSCEFNNNTAESQGAGLFVISKGKTFILDCDFKNNVIPDGLAFGGKGAALMIGETLLQQNSGDLVEVDVLRCHFNENLIETRGSGAAINIVDDYYKVKIDSCSFSDNEIKNTQVDTLVGFGAAISTGSNRLKISNSLFEGNKAYKAACIGLRGENEVNSNDQEITIKSCVMNSNIAPIGSVLNFDFGYNTTVSFSNCVMTKNQGRTIFSEGFITAGYQAFFDVINLEHCTLAYNSGFIEVDLAEMTVINSIFWNDDEMEFLSTGSNLDINNSIIKGGGIGASNIDADPEFISKEILIPTESSPCISGGIIEFNERFDIEGNVRPMPYGSLPDIGAYEVEFGTVGLINLDLIEIGIFPNPAQGFLNFEVLVDEVALYNKEGIKVIFNENVQTLSLENLKSGCYIVELMLDGKRSIQKLVKL